jgi:acyl-coenzyme A thioesterase PaaI-like protein
VPSIGPGLRRRWGGLSSWPGGRFLFSQLLGRFVPYTGTLGARVEQLAPGYCRVRLRDRRGVRNHLRSVHAMALANLAEMATGLALMYSLPDRARGILSGFDMEYLKKARGTLVAECRCAIPADNQEQECVLTGEIHDADHALVARCHARWRIGPEPDA